MEIGGGDRVAARSVRRNVVACLAHGAALQDDRGLCNGIRVGAASSPKTSERGEAAFFLHPQMKGG